MHFGTGNLSAEDYYYIQIESVTASSLGLHAQTQAEFLASHGANSSSSDQLNSLSWWSTVPASVQSQFDATQSVVENSSASEKKDYVFARDLNGNTQLLWGYASTGTTVDTYGGMQAFSAGAGASISTQDLAQQALDKIQNAIVSKDKIRAHLGALQNRLQNTVTNLQVQSENLTAAEAQITDVDVSTEMTQFVRAQILSQAAEAMLSQANSLPKMALQLMG